MGKTTKYILIALGVLVVLLIIGKATGVIGKADSGLDQMGAERSDLLRDGGQDGDRSGGSHMGSPVGM